MEVEAEWWSGSGGRLAEELDEEEVCILYIIKTILNILPLFCRYHSSYKRTTDA